MQKYYKRILELPEEGTETFFLWGARQTGKSTLLKHSYPNAYWIDLLKTEEYRRFLECPEILREELAYNNARFVVIDEIQKVPALLNEVHWLYENKGVHFALCGSSARRIKKGNANLLGGRGIHYNLSGFSAKELNNDLDFIRLLNNGYIPNIYSSDKPKSLLNSYISLYLKEEIASEGLVRKLPSFSRFLNIASLSDCEIINYTNIARDTGISSETIRGYFEILEDTLIGSFLPAYRKRPKRRTVVSPKFYFFDIGIVNFLALRGEISRGSELCGKAFENWIFHELTAYNYYNQRFAEMFFWRLSSGIEVDFLINHIECAIECKATDKINSKHLKGLRHLADEHPNVKKRMIVSFDPKNRKTDDEIDIIHYSEFLNLLWKGLLF